MTASLVGLAEPSRDHARRSGRPAGAAVPVTGGRGLGRGTAVRDTGYVPALYWAADGVVVVHLVAIAFMLSGGVLAWRWPRLLWLHAPVASTILAVNLLGADCPLTVLELRLRAAAGRPPYSGGFISHYLIQPMYQPGITPGVGTAVYAVAVVPNVITYVLLVARHRRSLAALPRRIARRRA